MKYKTDKGFSFIETIIAISIIAILTAVVGFSTIKYLGYAKVTACHNQIETFRLALQSYLLDCGTYPTESQGLSALWEKPVLAPVPSSWDGPYIDRQVPKDPWGNDYVYKNPGEKNLPFTIMSNGPKGEGKDEAIYSWK